MLFLTIFTGEGKKSLEFTWWSIIPHGNPLSARDASHSYKKYLDNILSPSLTVSPCPPRGTDSQADRKSRGNCQVWLSVAR